MRIDNEIKLDFKDVLIKPKRSTLSSRSQVNLEREFTFKHSPLKWKGVPIMAANMDTVGTFQMAISLYKHKMMTAIHKYYSLEDWKTFRDAVSVSETSLDIFNYMYSFVGFKRRRFSKIKRYFRKMIKIVYCFGCCEVDHTHL